MAVVYTDVVARPIHRTLTFADFPASPTTVNLTPDLPANAKTLHVLVNIRVAFNASVVNSLSVGVSGGAVGELASVAEVAAGVVGLKLPVTHYAFATSAVARTLGVRLAWSGTAPTAGTVDIRIFYEY